MLTVCLFHQLLWLSSCTKEWKSTFLWWNSQSGIFFLSTLWFKLKLDFVFVLLPTVAMYLGIKKGKIKTVNPAPSDSLGVWGPPAPWSLVISCGRFARCSMPTTATTNSKRVSCFFASTGTGEPRTWSSGRWRFASCPVSPSTASGSNGYPDHPSLSKTLLPKLPTS